MLPRLLLKGAVVNRLVVILWLLTGMRGLGFLLADIAAAFRTIHVVLVISNQGCEKSAIEESTRANCKFR